MNTTHDLSQPPAITTYADFEALHGELDEITQRIRAAIRLREDHQAPFEEFQAVLDRMAALAEYELLQDLWLLDHVVPQRNTAIAEDPDGDADPIDVGALAHRLAAALRRARPDLAWSE